MTENLTDLTDLKKIALEAKIRLLEQFFDYRTACSAYDEIASNQALYERFGERLNALMARHYEKTSKLERAAALPQNH